MSGFFLGSFIVYGAVVVCSFLTALLIFFTSKYCYAAGCGICRAKPKRIPPRTCWTIFTILSYTAVFIIFFKMIEY